MAHPDAIRQAAEEAYADYLSKRDEAADAVLTAEKQKTHFLSEGNVTQTKWDAALKARQSAKAAAATARDRALLWAEAVGADALCAPADVPSGEKSVVPKGPQPFWGGAVGSTGGAAVAFKRRLADVAAERMEEIGILKRVLADATRECAVKKEHNIVLYTNEIRRLLAERTSETESLDNLVSNAKGKMSEEIIEENWKKKKEMKTLYCCDII